VHCPHCPLFEKHPLDNLDFTRKVSSTRLVHYFRFLFAFLNSNSKSSGLLDDSRIDSIVHLLCLSILNRHIQKNAKLLGLLDYFRIYSRRLQRRFYCPLALLVDFALDLLRNEKSSGPRDYFSVDSIIRLPCLSISSRHTGSSAYAAGRRGHGSNHRITAPPSANPSTVTSVPGPRVKMCLSPLE
jgi:hypothetical protein